MHPAAETRHRCTDNWGSDPASTRAASARGPGGPTTLCYKELRSLPGQGQPSRALTWQALRRVPDSSRPPAARCRLLAEVLAVAPLPPPLPARRRGSLTERRGLRRPGRRNRSPRQRPGAGALPAAASPEEQAEFVQQPLPGQREGRAARPPSPCPSANRATPPARGPPARREKPGPASRRLNETAKLPPAPHLIDGAGAQSRGGTDEAPPRQSS